MSHTTGLVSPRKVTGEGEGLVTHGGLVWLGTVADRVGLSAGLEAATAGLEWRKHQPGHTLGLIVLGLADGATCVSDLSAIRGQVNLFGEVASHPTAWRSFDRLGPEHLAGIDAATADARSVVWRADPGGDRPEMVIDLDASIITTKADKQDAAPTWKRT